MTFNFTLLSRDQRLRSHEKRIRRELYAYTFVEEFETTETPDQLQDMLESVRDEIIEVENRLRLIETPEYKLLQRQLQQHVVDIREINNQRATVLQQYWSKRRRKNDCPECDAQLEPLAEQRDKLMDSAKKLEMDIYHLCCKLGVVCFEDFLPLRHVAPNYEFSQVDCDADPRSD